MVNVRTFRPGTVVTLRNKVSHFLLAVTSVSFPTPLVIIFLSSVILPLRDVRGKHHIYNPLVCLCALSPCLALQGTASKETRD